MGAMLDVTCASCGESFTVDDESAGRSEVCPYCGAFNDIPAPAEPAIEFEPHPHVPPPPSPVAGTAWWLVVFLIVGGFGAGLYWMLHSGDWERDHLQQLTDASRRGDAFLAAGQPKQAVNQYQLVLDTLDDRDIQSVYLRDLQLHAKLERQQAVALVAAAATRPGMTAPATTAPAAPAIASAGDAALPATAPDGGNPDGGNLDLHKAVTHFQREAESFADYVHARPVIFQDSLGNWRRRIYLLWNVEAEFQEDAATPQIMLRYVYNSRKTAPHADPSDAGEDSNFQYDDNAKPTNSQTLFEWHSGQWIAIQRQNDLLSSDNAAITSGQLKPLESADTDDLRKLEDGFFSAVFKQ
jgi:hypothetical protein